MHLDYEVIDGGYRHIRASVTEKMSGDLIFTEEQRSSVRTDWKVGGAVEEKNTERDTYEYMLCFENAVYKIKKTISFSWHVNQDVLMKIAKAGQLNESLKAKVDSLWEEIDSVRDMVHYFGLQQSNQHRTNQETNARVMWSSALEVGAVLLMTAVQVYVLKSLFEVRRHV